LRTTRAIILREATPIKNAQNKLQLLCRRRSLSSLHFLNGASTTKGVASAGCLVLHVSIHFLRPVDFPAVGQRDMQTLADRLWVFASKGKNVGQERLYTRVGRGRHRSNPEYIPSLGTRAGRDRPSIDNIEQSVICRDSELVSHVRNHQAFYLQALVNPVK
jgi:hypothetical protein